MIQTNKPKRECGSMSSTRFSININSVDFKFSSGHFVAFQGFRERLHGHNYTVSIHIEGNRINSDGYVLDFGDVKDVTKAACKELNEYLILPGKSDVLDIYVQDGKKITPSDTSLFDDMRERKLGEKSQKKRKLKDKNSKCVVPTNDGKNAGKDGENIHDAVASGRLKTMGPTERLRHLRQTSKQSNVEIVTEDGSYFCIPRSDVKILPIVHTTAEEFSEYLWDVIHDQLLRKLRYDGKEQTLRKLRGIDIMEVSVAERPIQRAGFRREVF